MHSKIPGWICCLVVGFFLAGFSAGAQTFGYTFSNAFPGLTFSNPVCITTPPGETNRVFILEKHGRVIVITNLASPTRTMFMDISSRVTPANTSESGDVNGEPGLLGLAFHPQYASNGFFYLFYTGQATNGGNGFHDILSRFQVSAGDPNQGDTNSEVRLIAMFDNQGNHNAGDIHFGPDGYLYVPFGDEGGANDSENNSQQINKDFYSAISRIDVDQQPGNLAPNPHPAIVTPVGYSIPSDNPYIGATNFNGLTVNSNQVRTEFWAVGFRNPWRTSYDSVSNTWYVADVGQGLLEEVDILQKGGNFGWAYREGNAAGPKSGSAPPGFVSIDPISQYGHTNGRIAVVGGFVYHGNRFPERVGDYFYGDYGSGEIFTLRYNGVSATSPQRWFADPGISAFGPDPRNGDVLYADLQSGNNSVIKRVVATNAIPFFTSATITDGNLVVAGSGGPLGGNYAVLTSGDASIATATWTPVATNAFDILGNFSFTNPVVGSQLFFRLQKLP